MHQTHSRHWGFSGNQERHSLSLPGVHSLELEGEQKVRLHFHRRNAEGSFPFCISQCTSTLAEHVCVCVVSSVVIKGSVVQQKEPALWSLIRLNQCVGAYLLCNMGKSVHFSWSVSSPIQWK